MLKNPINISNLTKEFNDDKVPTANEESYANTAGTKTAAASGASGDSGFNYTLPELMENVSMEVYYLPSTAGSTSSFEYGLTYTGVDNLTVGYAGGDNETTATATVEGTNLWATYVYDSFTLGVQRNETETLTEGTETGHQQPAVSGVMESYLRVLSKVSKK